MKADLPNYRIEFRFYSSKRKGGISSIIHSPGDLVHGVIYNVHEEEMLKLDEVESVPQGLYSRDTFLVLGEDGKWHDADLYQVVEPRGPFPPAKSYIALMLEGAKTYDLDSSYIERLEQLFKSLS
jgi:hypothetical protein